MSPELQRRALATLVRRGEDFHDAEDAVQEALVEALRVWPDHPPRDEAAWLVAVATRRLVDARRSQAARRRREVAVVPADDAAVVTGADDTLLLLFLCSHPELSPASQIALTLRAVCGLTTAEIADAFMVPEATMAQRISRAKRTLRDRPLGPTGSLPVVCRVLYLVYTAGHAGRRDLADEAIHLARQLHRATADPEVAGLLALMLLHHARRGARTDGAGRLVPLDRQDRSRWVREEIAEGVAIVQAALADGEPGRYRIEAAIAALHDDAATFAETDWPQILGWYDDLVALSPDPTTVLARAVALGHAEGPAQGLAALDAVPDTAKRWHAVRAYLLALAGDTDAAAGAYAEAARRSTVQLEREHLTLEAARLRAATPPGPWPRSGAR